MSTPPDTIRAEFDRLKAIARAYEAPSIRERKDHLASLADVISQRCDDILEALASDLGKSSTEAYTSEIGFVLRDLAHARRRLPNWARASRKHVPLMARPAKARVQSVPKGLVLILGPWNYPFQLLFSPSAAALAAGNRVIVKPSEHAPSTAEITKEICRAALPETVLSTYLGGPDVAAGLCTLPFDHIFFTGSTAVGRKVAYAAAQNLCPTTLELGGKSPCILLDENPHPNTFRRIMWGKCINSGQTCIAPDYVLAPHGQVERVANELHAAALTLVPERSERSIGPDYGAIVSDAHYQRLEKYLADLPHVLGGERRPASRQIAPCIVWGLDETHPLMEEEIFGPILPVVGYKDLPETLHSLRSGPAPLTAYVFGRNQDACANVVSQLRCGSACVNDTITQALPADLPFGGVGESGQGRYRGKAGFDEFSIPQAILSRPLSPDPRFRYPPFTTPLHLLKKAYVWLTR